MMFLCPRSKCYDGVDSVCTKIVMLLKAIDWNFPGIEVKFKKMLCYGKEYEWVSHIIGHDFRIWFCRMQGKLARDVYDVAAVNQINIPGKELQLGEWERGCKLCVYIGDDWEKDREAFESSSKVDSKLKGEPRNYLWYQGNHELKPSDHSQRDYVPNEDEVQVYPLRDVLREFATWLEENVCDQLSQAENMPDVVTLSWPAPPYEQGMRMLAEASIQCYSHALEYEMSDEGACKLTGGWPLPQCPSICKHKSEIFKKKLRKEFPDRHIEVGHFENTIGVECFGTSFHTNTRELPLKIAEHGLAKLLQHMRQELQSASNRYYYYYFLIHIDGVHGSVALLTSEHHNLSYWPASNFKSFGKDALRSYVASVHKEIYDSCAESSISEAISHVRGRLLPLIHHTQCHTKKTFDTALEVPADAENVLFDGCTFKKSVRVSSPGFSLFIDCTFEETGPSCTGDIIFIDSQNKDTPNVTSQEGSIYSYGYVGPNWYAGCNFCPIFPSHHVINITGCTAGGEICIVKRAEDEAAFIGNNITTHTLCDQPKTYDSIDLPQETSGEFVF